MTAFHDAAERMREYADNFAYPDSYLAVLDAMVAEHEKALHRVDVETQHSVAVGEAFALEIERSRELAEALRLYQELDVHHAPECKYPNSECACGLIAAEDDAAAALAEFEAAS